MGHNTAALSSVHDYPAIEAPDLRRYQPHDLRRVREFDAVVVAGGEQIQEGRFGNPLRGLLTSVFVVVEAARRSGKPVFLWAVGAQPLRSPISRLTLRRISRAATLVVRDRYSAEQLVTALQPRQRTVHVTADPVFSLKRATDEHIDEGSQLLGTAGSRPYMLVVPAHDRRVSLTYLEPFIEGCQLAATELSVSPRLLFTDLQPQYDATLLGRRELQPYGGQLVPLEYRDLRKLVGLIAGASVVVSARLHPLIVAATQSVPHVAVARSGKMTAFVTEFNGQAIETAELDAADLRRRIVREATRERVWSDSFRLRLTDLQARAAKTYELFASHVAGHQ